MKSLFILFFAVCIDGVQALLGLMFAAMQFATPVGGGVTGALLAGQYCWNTSTGILPGIVNAGKCFAAGGVVGAGISTFAIPLGAVVDVVISLLFGGLLIYILAESGMFSPGMVIATFVGESIPFFDIFPGWTILAWRATRQGSGGTVSLLGGALSALGGTLPIQSSALAFAFPGRPVRTAPPPDRTPAEPARSTRQTPALVTRNIDGIRPGNGNKPYGQAKVA